MSDPPRVEQSCKPVHLLTLYHSKTALLTTLACMVLTPLDSAAQYPYSVVATFGFGEVPEEHRNGSYAGSTALLWRVSLWADLGIEAGYQRFGTDPQHDIIGFCPILPVGACEGQITAERTSSGDLWFVGPTFRLGLKRDAALRPLALFGLGRYSSGERTRVSYSDDRGETVSLPGSGAFDRTFRGIGANGGLGLQGPGLGRFQWTVLARVHGAIGGMSGESASVSAYTVTAGLTLLLGRGPKVDTRNGTTPDQPILRDLQTGLDSMLGQEPGRELSGGFPDSGFRPG